MAKSDIAPRWYYQTSCQKWDALNEHTCAPLELLVGIWIRCTIIDDNIIYHDRWCYTFEKLYGYTPNISEYLKHKWFDWVYFNNRINSGIQRLGRWLGPDHSVGQGMVFHVLSDIGKVVTRSTVNFLISDLEKAEIKGIQEKLTKSI